MSIGRKSSTGSPDSRTRKNTAVSERNTTSAVWASREARYPRIATSVPERQSPRLVMTPARLPSGGAGVLAFGMPRPFRRTAALVAGLCLLPAVAWGEARVQVLEIDAATNKAIAQTAIAVDLTWTGAPVGSARPRPDWVVRMQVEQDHRVKEQSDAYVNRSTPWWATLLLFGLMWSAPAYFVLQAVALWRWDGGWRTAAMIPLLPMAAVLLYTIVAYRAGSNLFPLVLIFSSPPALLYLVVLMILRRRRLQAA